MGIESTGIDEAEEVDSVDAAANVAADDGTPDAPDGDLGKPDSATAEAGDVDGNGPAPDGAEPEQQPSEAGQRKLPTTRRPEATTTPQLPTNKPNTAGKSPAVDPRAEAGRWGEEKQRLTSQMTEMQKQLAAFQEGEQRRKAEADKLALKPWHPQHPDSAAAKDRIGRVKAYMNALNAIPPEAQTDAVKAKLARELRVSNEDAKLHDDFEAHRESVVNQLSSDPEGFLDQRVQQVVPRLIQDAFNQFFAHQRAEQDVSKMMADPAKIAPHADLIRERLQSGSSLKDVMEIVELKNRLAALEGNAGAVAGKTEEVTRREKAAAERERLAKGAAGITRDPKTTGKPDFYAQALKESREHAGDRSWQPGGSRFNKHLARLEEAHHNAGDPA
jgi:hypothetical protein